jgi:hypothetical protein
MVVMNVRLRIDRDGKTLYEGVHDICDADSFARACGAAWTRLQELRLAKATSVGALYDRLEERLLDDLVGAEITLAKA